MSSLELTSKDICLLKWSLNMTRASTQAYLDEYASMTGKQDPGMISDIYNLTELLRRLEGRDE